MDDEFICPNCNSKEILDQKFDKMKLYKNKVSI